MGRIGAPRNGRGMLWPCSLDWIALVSLGLGSCDAAPGEWDGAEDELTKGILEGLRNEPDTVMIAGGSGNLAKIARCGAKASIEFLNKTSCKYRFNPKHSSMEEHLEKQDACIRRVKLEDHQAVELIRCVAQVVGNDWELARDMLTQLVEEEYESDIPDSKERERFVHCYTDKFIAHLRAQEVKPYDLNAKTVNGMVKPMEEMDKLIPDEQIDTIISTCQ